MKIIEQSNPFVAGGVAKYPVIRETKTQYITAHTRYRKPQQESDGCIVRAIGADRWDEPCILRITKDKEK